MTQDLRTDLATGEGVRLPVVTSDPQTASSGYQAWIRSDLGNEYQIGQLVWSDGLSIPIYPRHVTTDSNVDEWLSVPVDGTIGFVPVAAVANAAHDGRQIPLGGSDYALHDSPSLSTWPPSTLTRPQDDREVGYTSTQLGFQIYPDQQEDSITVTISSNCSFGFGSPKVRLQDFDTVLDSVTGISPGDTVTLDGPLEQRDSDKVPYTIYIDPDADGNDVGYYSNPEFPYYLSNATIPAGHNIDATTDRFYGFNDITLGGGGSAIPDSAVDTYEWAGVLSDRYSVVDSGFDLNTDDPVLFGDYSLKQTTEGSKKAFSFPNDTTEGQEVPRHPTAGDEPFGLWTYQASPDGSFSGLIFGASDTDNYWTAFVSSGSNILRLRSVINGSTTDLDVDVPLSQDTWYGIYITNWDTSSDELTVEVRDVNNDTLASNTVTDSFNQNAGGVGINIASGGGLHHFDGGEPE